MWKNQQRVSIDFVLPASVPKEPLTLELRHAYILLCSELLYFAVHIDEAASFPNLPLLKANLEYRDIGGVQHNVEFELTVDIAWIGGKDEEMHGTVACRRSA